MGGRRYHPLSHDKTGISGKRDSRKVLGAGQETIKTTEHIRTYHNFLVRGTPLVGSTRVPPFPGPKVFV